MSAMLEKALLWSWAHRELGDEACEAIQAQCDQRPEGTPCICRDVLATLLVLP